VLTWSVGAFVDKAAGRLIRLPPEILETITFDRRIERTTWTKRSPSRRRPV
jgi:hypothetical protein